MGRDGREAKPTLAAADLIPDERLRNAEADKLEHDAVAAVVADLVTAVQSSANIALFGPWGSGKSSLFTLIKARLDSESGHQVSVIHYDAWKFAGPGLHRNFLNEVVRQLNLSDRDKAHIEGGVETTRLRLGTYLIRNWRSLLGAVGIATAAGIAWTLLRAWARTDWDSWHSVWAAVPDSIPAGGAAIGLVIAGLILSNQSISSAIEKRTQSPLQDADQFFAAFDQMMSRLTRQRWFRKKKQVKRLVVFVDELDRCSPDTVVDSLVQIMTYLGHPKCIRENEPYYSTSGAFLDKVFQHQVRLPPTRPEALTAYAMALANEADGIWKELRDIGQREYEDVVYSLVPSHVRSPRRVKILMNDFATTARVMEQRGLSWRSNAVQVAILTVVQTEFPSVARDFLTQPRLLDALVGGVTDQSDELVAAVRKYESGADESTPPVPILSGEASHGQRATSRRLNEQLHAYLTRMRATGAPMPTTDLVYVQSAAHADGLEDEQLSRLLDIAADIAPDQLIAEFTGASEADRIAAIRFLIAQLGNKFGPLRANLIESASRIAFLLDADSAMELAPIASAPILGEVTTGRWRSGMTRGAIWLGLLDRKGGDPLAALEGSGELESLAESGALAELIPRMDALGDAADRLFPYIGEAYSDHPEVFCQALTELSPSIAARLWEAESENIDDWLLLQAGAAVSSAATAETPGTELDAPSPETVAAERYHDLLDAVCRRQSLELSPVVVALVGLVTTTAMPLREVVVDHHDTIRPALSPSDRNSCALALVAAADTVDEVAVWTHWLDSAISAPHDLAARAGEACATKLVGNPTGAQADVMVGAIETILTWVTKNGADDIAKVAHDTLNATAPDGTPESVSVRAAMRRLLRALEVVHPDPGYVDGYFLGSHGAALDGGAVTEAGCDQFIKEVRQLAQDKGQHLDAKIVANTTAGNDGPSMVRLRIAARHTAGLSSLKASEVTSALPANSVIGDWISTNPPIGEFLQLVKKFKPTPSNLSTYASMRNVNDRSRLWISIEKAGWEDQYLEAVGKHGVNKSVVARIESQIAGAKLLDQTAAVKRLVSANLGFNSDVRSAANDLTIAMLKTKLAGSGSNAVKIAKASHGAAPGRKDELRRAFDTYFGAIASNQVPKGELRALDEMKLLTPRQKSPLASILGWLK